ncbi:MAG: SAP domain-containing protein [gamma proteobacterium symbiont of Bathyaustriella thionipta]|nr:SAP domain-containing protein [gamma proteobacterium symbiont of Bathyaustriella thionipta]MCU7950702.1 SAP domain-containing protein [gamma proteobacterium symbiont of Bathyaustriella thionipta]MCU7953756.1 SAP domain-containing protein [gamma proteobacterium symbiont of Bathyaustriella thionipta]MCU7957477.1 SAP domain-containing protein [gamma proteobacterium symbiont of Bathyaustriella thionipta]MCU7967493.1 SAP domain-containing protein [gamma proteobacterium symbiont of Bathyaustriella
MIMSDIRKIAQQHRIKTSKLNKTMLVRKIQTTEGNFDCFATASSNYCDQPECIWQVDCLKLAKQKK